VVLLPLLLLTDRTTPGHGTPLIAATKVVGKPERLKGGERSNQMISVEVSG
jgi:hypothetical protein